MSLAPLWIDTPEASDVALQQPEGWLRDALANLVMDGFAVIPEAVESTAVDAYRAELKSLLGRPSGLTVARVDTLTPAEAADLAVPLSKLLDPYVFAASALPVMFAPKLQAFLGAVFADGVLAFQGLHFEVGSTQAVHQDTAYIATSEPSRFAASWVALEDIEPGSGELTYYPGSHRWPLQWDSSKPYSEAQSEYLASLPTQAAERGVKAQSFRPKKGDALIWHSDLAHGGGPITRPDATRRSLVTHYCGLNDTPRYFRLPERAVKRSVGPRAGICSRHYPLSHPQAMKPAGIA